jgi:hypothetical protein
VQRIHKPVQNKFFPLFLVMSTIWLSSFYVDTNRFSLESGFRSEKVYEKNADNLDPEGKNLG